MVCFVSQLKPLSIQSHNHEKYKKKLLEEFNEYKYLYKNLPLDESLYSKIIYIHSERADIDVDNMSKPFVDAFRGAIYPDDGIINHRICSKISLDELEIFELNIGLLPDVIADKYIEYSENNSKHIVYYEVGAFTPKMVFIGGEDNET